MEELVACSTLISTSLSDPPNSKNNVEELFQEAPTINSVAATDFTVLNGVKYLYSLPTLAEGTFLFHKYKREESEKKNKITGFVNRVVKRLL